MNRILTHYTSHIVNQVYIVSISGSALSLLSSYLHNRSHSVSVNSHLSSAASISTGVPQGSVLGPLLLCLYAAPLTYLLSDSPVSFQLYADDTQLYISFSSADVQSRLSAFSSALDSVYHWFSSNRLSINPSRTEFLLIGTPQQRLKFTSLFIAFRSSILTPTSHCRNLGVVFDSDLSFDKHISSICSSSSYQIRQLR